VIGLRRLLAGPLADVTFALLLTAIGIAAFSRVFDGVDYLVAGVGGAAIAVVVVLLLGRIRVPALVGMLAMLAVYLVAGSLLGGFGTSPEGIRHLVEGSIAGWHRIITLAPPVADEGYILAVPFFCGFIGAGGAVALAHSFPRAPLCLVPPTGVLVAALLLGTQEPNSLVLQGAVFAGVIIVWLALRDRRRRPLLSHSTGARRVIGTVGLFGVAAVAGVLGAPHTPGASGRTRYVLRDIVVPEFDPRVYPSPLTGFRRYQEKALKEQPQFSVAGTGDDPLRLAVMTDYDGVVWTVTGQGAAGAYDRVSQRIDPPSPGERPVTITADAPATVWTPTIGDVRAIEFRGPRAEELRRSFRFNRQAEAGAAPLLLQAGDGYRLTSVLTRSPDEAALKAAQVDARFAVPPPADLPSVLEKKARELVNPTDPPYVQAKALESWFRDGYYSDGGAGTGIAPGHSVSRIIDFLKLPKPVGNAEQYAASMGVLGRILGLPTRVVMGFRPKAAASAGARVVHGGDVDAWVEVAFEGAGWVPFHPTPDTSRVPQPQQVPKPKSEQADVQVPPQSDPSPPPTITPGETRRNRKAPQPREARGAPWIAVAAAKYVGLPITALLLGCLVIIELKHRRRRRRRRRGTPAVRIAAGWRELLDLARDIRRPLPQAATRYEASRILADYRVESLASEVDAAVFGADDPSDDHAEVVWGRVDEAIAALRDPLSRKQRIRSAVSLTSLVSSR
jgi:transglutaminase-like putative cysteine protease